MCLFDAPARRVGLVAATRQDKSLLLHRHLRLHSLLASVVPCCHRPCTHIAPHHIISKQESALMCWPA